MNKYLSMLCLTTLLVMQACATQASKESSEDKGLYAKKMPAWVLENQDQGMDIYGVGSAEVYAENITNAKKRAFDSALHDLVSKLKVTVSGETTQHTQEQVTYNNGQRENNFSKAMSSKVSAKVAAFDVFNAEQKQAWFDQKNKQLYVQVYLDREKEAANIRYNIQKLDMKLLSLNEIPESTDTLQDIKRLLPALSYIAEQEGLYQRYQLIAGKALPSLSTSADEIKQKINSLAAKLKVSIQASSADANGKRLHSGMIEAFNRLGMQVLLDDSQTKAADLYLSYNLTEEVIEKNQTYYAMSTAQFVVQNKQGKRVIDIKRQSKGVSSMANKAKVNAATKLVKVFENALFDYFLNTKLS